MEESLSKFMVESAKRHDENSNLIKEIQASTDAAIKNQGASIKALEIQISYEEKEVLGELMDRKEYATNLKRLLMEKPKMGYQIEASMNVHDSSILDDSLSPKEKRPSLGELAPTNLIIELDDRTIKCPNGIAENVLVDIDKFVFPIDFIVLDMPEDIKVPLILGRPFLSTVHAKIDVFKRKITLRVGDDKIVFKSDNPTSSIIRRVYALGLRKRMELDLEVRLMGEALILNRSLDHVYGYYNELNGLNELLELKRNQVEDLGLTIEEGEVIDEPMKDMTRNDDNEISFEHVNVNFFPILSINVMSKKFYNSIMKDKIEYKGKNVVGSFINVPIFVGNFSVVTDFVVVENMVAYRDHDMGEVIVGKPFCREIYVKARRFDGMITIYNGNDIVSAQDELNGISHPYQKLKSFYKGVLNLRPEYIRDAKIEELLTRRHVSIHEMK
ncbi:putative reverse transcriptase domain-containing protein [Tanacetum coccineum]